MSNEKNEKKFYLKDKSSNIPIYKKISFQIDRYFLIKKQYFYFAHKPKLFKNEIFKVLSGSNLIFLIEYFHIFCDFKCFKLVLQRTFLIKKRVKNFFFQIKYKIPKNKKIKGSNLYFQNYEKNIRIIKSDYVYILKYRKTLSLLNFREKIFS